MMKLKTKPVKPSRSKRTHSVHANYTTLDTILDDCRRHLVDSYKYTSDEAIKLLDYKDITVETEWDYDCETVSAMFTAPVSDYEFRISNQQYRKKLTAYNKWCVDNADEINEELARRVEAKKIKDAEKAQREVDRLTKELAAIHLKMNH